MKSETILRTYIYLVNYVRQNSYSEAQPSKESRSTRVEKNIKIKYCYLAMDYFPIAKLVAIILNAGAPEMIISTKQTLMFQAQPFRVGNTKAIKNKFTIEYLVDHQPPKKPFRYSTVYLTIDRLK
jgi:hypothetical protein